MLTIWWYELHKLLNLSLDMVQDIKHIITQP